MADSYNQADNTYQLTALNPTGGYENVEAGTPYKDIQTTTYVELSAGYNCSFGVHGVSGMLVYTMRNQQNSNYENLQLSLPHRNLGLSGRFTYAYNQRYFVEFNFVLIPPALEPVSGHSFYILSPYLHKGLYSCHLYSYQSKYGLHIH